MEYKFDKENHIHTLDGRPLIGTSSMSSVLAKGGLTWWASGLACEKFGWTNKGNATKGWAKKEDRLKQSIKVWKKIALMNPEEYLNLLDEAYSAHTTKLKDSASLGTDMHQLMEDYIKFCIENNEGEPVKNTDLTNKQVNLFSEWAKKNVKKFIVSEGYCYSKEYWLGGIVDCVYEDMKGEYVILDFKSSKEVYLSQFWQCIGYALQIEENGIFTEDGELIVKLDKPISYVAVLPFGMPKPEVQFNYDMAGGKDAVKAMITLYKKLN